MKIGSCHDNELLCYRHFPKDLPLCFVMCSPWQHLWGKQGREYLHGIEDRGSNDLREASYTAGGFFWKPGIPAYRCQFSWYSFKISILTCQICANVNSSGSCIIISVSLITFPSQSQILRVKHRKCSRKYLWHISQQPIQHSLIHSRKKQGGAPSLPCWPFPVPFEGRGVPGI